MLNDDHQIINDTEGSIGEFAKQIKANDDSTNLVSQNLGSMPRVQRRSEALTQAGHIRKIEFQDGQPGQQFPITTATIPGTTIGEGT